MANYFGIDLGTSNTVITTFNDAAGDILESGSSIKTVPIYYKRYALKENAADIAAGVHTVNELFVEQSATGDIHATNFISLPSVMYRHTFEDTKGVEHSVNLVGKPASDFYNDSRNRMIRQAECFYDNSKRLMDRVDIGEGITPTDIACELLKVCFESIAKFLHEKRILINTSYIAISYPVAVNSAVYLRSLKEAAQRAVEESGYRFNLTFMYHRQEPIAALMNLLYRESRNPEVNGVLDGTDTTKTIMVVDIGGGTTDVALELVHLNNGTGMPSDYPQTYSNRFGHNVQEAVNANRAFGGYQFDKIVAERLIDKLCRDYADCVPGNFEAYRKTAYYRNMIRSAFLQAREIKHYFSQENREDVYERNIQYFFSDVDDTLMTIRVSNEEFEEWISPYVYDICENIDWENAYQSMDNSDTKRASIQTILESTLAYSNCRSWKEVDAIFVTGGMSNVPMIRRMISHIAKDAGVIIFSSDCMQDISMGLTLSITAGITHVFGDEAQVGSITALGLMADTGNELPEMIIEPNSRLPIVNQIKKNVLRTQDTVGFTLQLYTGHSPLDQNLQLQDKYEMRFINPPMVGTPVSIRYSVDEDMHTSIYVFFENGLGKIEEHPLQLVLDRHS